MGKGMERGLKRKNMFFLKTFQLFLFLAFIFSFFFSVHCFSKAKIDTLSSSSSLSYLNLKERISKNNERERDILSSLYELNQKIKKNRQKKTRFSKSLFSLKIKSQKIARQIVSLEKKLEIQKKKFQKQIRNLYKLNRVHYLEFLFSSLNPLDWERNLKYLKEMSKKNEQKIKDYKTNSLSFSLRKKALEKSVTKLILTKKKLKKKERELEKIQKQKKALLESLRQKKMEDLKAIQWAKKENKDENKFLNQKEIQNLLQASFFEFKGELPPPVTGSVLIPYGVKTDLIYSFPIYHKGEFYSVSSSSSVYSIYSGEVGFVGPLNGHRQVIVLDHGDHYYSVYANLSQIFVKKGDKVFQSQVIGQATNQNSFKVLKEKRKTYSFSRFQMAGLYFEMRHFSDPLDPGLWLKKKDNQNLKRKK